MEREELFSQIERMTIGLDDTFKFHCTMCGKCLSSCPVSLDKNECVLYNLYPVDKDGKAFLGRRDKFVGISTETVREINVADL